MVIASCTDGRVRLRDPRLKGEVVASAVREALEGLPGVNAVAVSGRVGSLLVLFDEGVAALQSILDALRDLLGPEVPAETTAGAARPALTAKEIAGRRRMKNRIMLGFLIIGVAAAIADVKSFHVRSGILFLMMLAQHLYERWRMLFPKTAPIPAHAV